MTKSTVAFVPLLCGLLAGCAAEPADPAPEGLATVEAALVNGAGPLQVLRGRDDFHHETLGGNGRTCATCHVSVERALDLGLGVVEALRAATFDLTPAMAARIRATRPHDELFLPLDSDDLSGASYHRLAEDGLVRVHITLAPGITIDEMDSPNVEVLPDGRIRLALLRSVPSLLNIGLEDFIMWDGREPSLEHQVGSAVSEHAPPGRAPTAGEARDIAQFERQLYSSLELAAYAEGGPAPSLPACTSPSSCRGRTFFQQTPALVSDMGHRGLCAMCHSGPMLNETNPFNPVQPPEALLPDGTCPQLPLPTVPRDIGTAAAPDVRCFHRMSNNVVAERNNAGLPVYTFRFQDPFFGPIVLRSPDPGHVLLTGNACEFAAACFLNPGSTQSVFRITSLWGAGKRKHFLHDNSARDLGDVLAHLQDFFHETAVGLAAFGDPNAAAFEISDADAADIIAYLKLL